MNIVLSTDSNYVFQTCVTIYSAVRNNPAVSHIYVLGSGLKKTDEEYFQGTARHLKRNITIIAAKQNAECRILDTGHLTSATFNRLMLDKLLPEPVDKILYLDSDIVVAGDITKLYNRKMAHCMAVVVEGFISRDKEHIKKAVCDRKWKNTVRCGAAAKRRVGFSRNEKYFNAGVMLLNMPEIRRNDIGQRCIEAQKEIRYFDADQGVLNYVLKNDVAYAPEKYNCRPDVYARKWQRYLRRKAVIFHYSQKPWKKLYVRGGSIWWRYAFELDKQSSIKILKDMFVKRGR